MSANAGFLDRYLEGNSFLHRADASVKLVVTLGFIFSLTSLPPGAWPAFGVMIVLVWGTAAFSTIGMARVFRRSLLATPFVLIALPTVFTRAGAPLFDLDLGVGHLTATRAGAEFFASVLLKSWGSVTATVLLTATTPQVRILDALRSLRVPPIILSIVSLMYRYLFVLVEEAQRLMRARKARSTTLGPRSGGTIAWRASVTGGMAGSLFVRTLDRGERIYMAMLARGYDGRMRATSTPRPGRASLAQAAVALAWFAVIAGTAQMFW